MGPHSALNWLGGKYASARRILGYFPEPSQFDVYAEPFCGAAHLLFAKPRGRHIEAINDINNNLINFWLCVQSHADEMQERLFCMPYSHVLYDLYRKSILDNTPLDDIERACRWFYVLRSSFQPPVSSSGQQRHHGWLAGPRDYGAEFRNAVDLLERAATRLAGIQMDNRDFEPFIKLYEGARTFFYCDPPYFGAEHYYSYGTGEEYEAFHERLARVLNATPSQVALSYAQDTTTAPILEKLYPASRWQRYFWQRTNSTQRSLQKQDKVVECLLCNYNQGNLWTFQGDSDATRPGDVER